jgi:hypothetical protein
VLATVATRLHFDNIPANIGADPMKRLLLLAIALIAAACTAPTPPEQPAAAPFIGIDNKPLVMADGTIDNAVQEALTASPDACAKAGGALAPVCRMQSQMCVITFADAGAACTDGSGCASGRCMAKEAMANAGQPVTGMCAATNDPCGCYTRIEDGVAQPTICVD